MPSQFLDEIPDSLIDWKRREAGMERMRSGWRNDGFDDGFSDEFGGWDDGDSDYGAGAYGRSSYGSSGRSRTSSGSDFGSHAYGSSGTASNAVAAGAGWGAPRRSNRVRATLHMVRIVFLGPLTRLRILYGCIWSPLVAWRFLIIPFLGFPFGCCA